MRVTFLLPAYLTGVSGGYRVVFEYANRLSRRGHDVSVVMPCPGIMRSGLRRLMSRGGLRDQARLHVSRQHLIPWFRIDERVSIKTPWLSPARALPKADALIATSWHTAGMVAMAPADRGDRYQLLQHYETWDGPRALVDDSWRLPLHKIVIAKWLGRKAEELCAPGGVTYIPNGLNQEHFGLDVPMEDRQPVRVGILYHPSKWKGFDVGVAAMRSVHGQRPDVQFHAFGQTPRPSDLPAWIDYSQALDGASLRRYYNSLSIFLHTSFEEGWGLPPAEAMLCGVAVAACANEGVSDYAEHEVTALFSEPGDYVGLGNSLLRLVDNDDLRHRLAASGRREMQMYTWDRAVDAFEEMLVARKGGN